MAFQFLAASKNYFGCRVIASPTIPAIQKSSMAKILWKSAPPYMNQPFMRIVTPGISISNDPIWAYLKQRQAPTRPMILGSKIMKKLRLLRVLDIAAPHVVMQYPPKIPNSPAINPNTKAGVHLTLAVNHDFAWSALGGVKCSVLFGLGFGVWGTGAA